MKILGIETSCDETAAAVVQDGRRALSNVIRTQFDLHGRFGGVVPELASRRHVEVIWGVAQEALDRAQLTLSQLDGLAVTQGPGLMGALLVGVNMAKALAYVTGLPLAGANHLAAHVSAAFLEPCPPPRFPAAALVVSGGHTNLYLARAPLDLELKGRTRDDAAGEAYDKAAKLLGLGYPGGVAMDRLAAEGDRQRFVLPRPMARQGLDFSFSGLKTALVNLVKTEFGGRPPEGRDLADVCAGFQEAAVDVLVLKTRRLLEREGVDRLIMAGGVAANSRLREAMAQMAGETGVELVLPPIGLCTDNAAMVAATGFHLLRAGRLMPPNADAYSRSGARC